MATTTDPTTDLDARRRRLALAAAGGTAAATDALTGQGGRR